MTGAPVNLQMSWCEDAGLWLVRGRSRDLNTGLWLVYGSPVCPDDVLVDDLEDALVTDPYLRSHLLQLGMCGSAILENVLRTFLNMLKQQEAQNPRTSRSSIKLCKMLHLEQRKMMLAIISLLWFKFRFSDSEFHCLAQSCSCLGPPSHSQQSQQRQGYGGNAKTWCTLGKLEGGSGQKSASRVVLQRCTLGKLEGWSGQKSVSSRVVASRIGRGTNAKTHCTLGLHPITTLATNA